ncbi:MAG: DUF3185 domain-containing protein [Planctomycetia bacterium]|nr:DUF3185 domain-containing protein [Planctomycetia bacterium]
MKPAVLVGLLLIVLALVAFSYQGYLWVTTQEQVAQIGPVGIFRDKHIPIPVMPIAAAVALIGGVLLLARGSRSPS